MLKRRWSFAALLAVFLLVVAACGDDDATTTTAASATTTTAAATTTTAGETTTTAAAVEPFFALVYDLAGRGDKSFNDSAAAGLDRAVDDFGLGTQFELEPTGGGENREELLRLAATQPGVEFILGNGFLFADSVAAIAAENPGIMFAVTDGFVPDLSADSNMVMMGFAEHEGSFLVGAAAALKSTTGHIGFIGGVEIELIEKFEAGFVAGAREINPDIVVDISYISQPPDFTGFNDPARGKEIARGMYDAGADVVYAAAGGSGTGMFQAAKEYSEEIGTHVWGIGVDSDSYQVEAAELQPYILTSMLKEVGNGLYNLIEAFQAGALEGGYISYSLADGGVSYSTSGGFIDDIVDQLEDLKAQIIDGTIVVPTTP